jgi:hypothetical protein
MIHKLSDDDVSCCQENWNGGDPFPHIVLDRFVEDAFVLSQNFPPAQWSNWVSLGDRYQHNKYICSDVSVYPPVFSQLISELSGPKFLQQLEQVTSIKGLIPDPYLEGGGLHLSLSGGILAPHTDFHVYRRLGLYRRLNLILYLNQDWQHGDGGELELTRHGQNSEARIVEPLMNRAILFQTDDDSVHGFTTAVREGTSRRSIAVYYYTSLETEHFSGDQTTHWREHGSLGFMKNVRLVIYKILLKISRIFSIVAHIINPNQGLELVRTRLKKRK